jgi:hypothetical protein
VVAYVRHPLTFVWAFLTATTIASWLISRDGGSSYQVNAAVTLGVLLIAAVKARLVIQFFMEARHAPVWLKRTLDGWLVGLMVLLLATYAAYL